MADPVRRITSGDKHFDFAGLMSNEMIQVTKWTGIEKRSDFHQAILNGDATAAQAAFTVVAWRELGPTNEVDPPRWGSVVVDVDDLKGFLHVDGRRVELLYEREENGDPLFVLADKDGLPVKDGKGKYVKPTGAEGEQKAIVPLLHPDGSLKYKFVDTGEEVPSTPV